MADKKKTLITYNCHIQLKTKGMAAVTNRREIKTKASCGLNTVFNCIQFFWALGKMHSSSFHIHLLLLSIQWLPGPHQ